ncbi:MAG TPA: site-specific DNA-methyltransferase [Chloroflexia bacterium]|nr:site-specific DNA-methyltransferase [Chloroflexia bacterium]
MSIAFQTPYGTSFHGPAEVILTSPQAEQYQKQVRLIFTSPPFPLNRKKKYGNLNGQAYIDWLVSFAPLFKDLLMADGSIVIEMGNSWEPGRPIMSTLALRALLALQEHGQFHLCQQFIWHNSARLPSPAQWVNVERIRLKDAFTYLWWLSPTERPKADNRRVLKEYSDSMQKLLVSGRYNAGKRPSEHHIGQASFLNDNNGAIPSNVITLANTQASSDYLNYCRENGLQPHPARMPPELASFFIRFLTDQNDLVLDPFAGSNTTGSVAESLQRRWIAVEASNEYIAGSKGRFNLDPAISQSTS